MTQRLDFETHPNRYRHWRIELEPNSARLVLDVDEHGGAFDGYELKLNSYDIGVDIELADAVQRLRFEQPNVRLVVITSAKANSFCAGANIRMLALASHVHKVNFCKFTNETRNAIEDATTGSGQRYIAAINGTAAGGGYELALSTDRLLLIDDGNAAVSLPEVPLLAVLPGTGGLTRLTDKRNVRPDLADVFCTLEEGMRGQRAVTNRLVDEAIPRSRFDQRIDELVTELAGPESTDRQGVELPTLMKSLTADTITYRFVTVTCERRTGSATVVLRGPDDAAPGSAKDAHLRGAAFWPLTLLRELDDALLELRFNEPSIGSLVLKSDGCMDEVMAYDAILRNQADHWFVNEINLLAQRVFKRLDLTSRSLFALVEPGGCFGGFLAEVLFAADRAYMLDGTFEDAVDVAPATMTLSDGNFGAYAMVNGLSRLATRFLGDQDALSAARDLIGQPLPAIRAADAGLVTFALDEIDWDDEIRLLLEERAGFSPDALTGMEANLRFGGPETMESKIFARLTAWQNWIFQRPNAVGETGALPLYGTGRRPIFDKTRV